MRNSQFPREDPLGNRRFLFSYAIDAFGEDFIL